jgi:hypothetical protein
MAIRSFRCPCCPPTTHVAAQRVVAYGDKGLGIE